MKEENEAIYQYLEKEIRTKGLTIKEACIKAGITEQAYQQGKRHKSTPEKINKILTAIGSDYRATITIIHK